MVRHVLIDGKTQDDSGFLNAPGNLKPCLYNIRVYIYMYIHTNIHYIYNVNTYYEMHLCILHVYTVYSNIYIYNFPPPKPRSRGRLCQDVPGKPQWIDWGSAGYHG
jgi:hypothetical protein